jgi:sugar/nucleoside kinase (ribokinase family)
MVSSTERKHILCTGIAVLDLVFRVETLPRPDRKTQASDFRTVSGGNAANAAVAIAHLGGRVSFAGPLGGPPGSDTAGDTFLALAAREGIDCSGCPRIAGVPSSISAIAIDARGERAIVNYRDEGLTQARADDPAALVAEVDAVIADNRFPEYVHDVCAAARKRNIPVVLDADEPRRDSNALFAVVSHVIFSAEGLRATAGTDSLGRALIEIGKQTDAFLAVTDGANDVLWLDQGELRQVPAYHVDVVDTLGAGDTFHGAFTLMLAEGMRVRGAMRFAAATAALKCTRYGGIASAPRRAEVEAFLAARD